MKETNWLRRAWDWLVDAHLELPEDKEKETTGKLPALPAEQEWQRKIRVLNEMIDERKRNIHQVGTVRED